MPGIKVSRSTSNRLTNTGRLMPSQVYRTCLLVVLSISVISLLFSYRQTVATRLVGTSHRPAPQTVPQNAVNPVTRLTPNTDHCKHLIAGNHSRKRLTSERGPLRPPRTASLQELVSGTLDCAKFKQLQDYVLEPSSEEEASFPLAFTIVMHKDPDQVEILLRAIYQPQNTYCIHVDAKASTPVHLAMKHLASCFHNVFIASRLEEVVYASFSRLQADINCMRDLVERSATWRYLMNLAGQSFPLKTNWELVRTLRANNGSNDIEALHPNRTLHARFKFVHKLEMSKRTHKAKIVKTNVRKDPPPHGLVILKGSAYGVFSRAFAQFVLTNEMARDLLEWSWDTYSPDEHFWATLNHLYYNPQLKTPGGYAGIPWEKPFKVVHVNWLGHGHVCHGKYIRWVCVFGVKDLPQLVQQSELFLNKVYADYQPLTLTCLNWWIHNKTRSVPDMSVYGTHERLSGISKLENGSK